MVVRPQYMEPKVVTKKRIILAKKTLTNIMGVSFIRHGTIKKQGCLSTIII